MRNTIILLCFPFFVFAQLGQGLQSFSVNGRNYDVTTPSNYDANKVYPIVFELHSFGENRFQMHHQEVINGQQYISIRPEGKELPFVNFFISDEKEIKRAWNTWNETNDITGNSNDVSYITDVYNDIKQKMGTTFNPEKVYVYGYSNGGAMAMKMIQETNLFKAVAIRSMSFVSGHNIPSTASKIPMIFVHGTNDDTVPYKGGKGKFGTLSPRFESIKNTVQKWATHNGLSNPLEIKYLKDDTTISKQDFYFREYSHSTHPLYFFVIDGGEHGTKDQFSNANIKRALIRLAKNPKQFGIYRNR